MEFNQYLNSNLEQGSTRMNVPRVSRHIELSRSYQAGDPVEMIDWRAYARTDELIVREEKKTAHTRVSITLEANDSMQWPDKQVIGDMDVCSKLNIAARIVLHLAYRHIRMGDQVDIFLREQDILHERRIKSPLEVLNHFSDWQALNFSLERILSSFSPAEQENTSPQIAYWISDLCHENPKWMRGAESVKSFVLFHILSFLEIDPSWIVATDSYYDRKTRLKEYRGSDLIKDDQYRHKLRDWRRSIQRKCESLSGHYIFLSDRSTLSLYANYLDEIAEPSRLHL